MSYECMNGFGEGSFWGTMAHHGVEVLGCYVTVLVEICLCEDLVHLVVSQVLPQFFSNLLELLSCYLPLNQ